MAEYPFTGIFRIECVHFDQFEDVTSEAEVTSDNLTGPSLQSRTYSI